MRILIVEDNFLVADMLCEVLRDQGCEVVGPAPSVERSEKYVEAADADGALSGALLDVNLNGETSFKIAGMLRARGIPFIFLTGYGDQMKLPDEFNGVRRMAKPCDIGELAAAMRAAF
jgi:DNA-binding response OmpR family regulator